MKVHVQSRAARQSTGPRQAKASGCRSRRVKSQILHVPPGSPPRDEGKRRPAQSGALSRPPLSTKYPHPMLPHQHHDIFSFPSLSMKPVPFFLDELKVFEDNLLDLAFIPVPQIVAVSLFNCKVFPVEPVLA